MTSIPDFISLSCFYLLFNSIYSIIGIQLFRDNLVTIFPSTMKNHPPFHTFGYSLFTLFQISLGGGSGGSGADGSGVDGSVDGSGANGSANGGHDNNNDTILTVIVACLNGRNHFFITICFFMTYLIFNVSLLSNYVLIVFLNHFSMKEDDKKKKIK